MLVLIVMLYFIKASQCGREQGLTPSRRYNHNYENVAAHGDAEHRGYRFYGHSSANSKSSSGFGTDTSSSSMYSESMYSPSRSSDASSALTSERRTATKKYRSCTPCPHDMLKKHTNIGIKWICGAYQRARRTFKSECMMRYRNCQDGTMFIKFSDHRCQKDDFHGKHWFYVYKVD